MAIRGVLWAQGVAVAALGIAGAAVFFGAPGIGSPFTSSLHFAMGIDPLTGFFLAVLSITAFPALVFAGCELRNQRFGMVLAVLTGGFLASLVGLLVARDVITFLFCWEAMSAIPAIAILVGRSDQMVRRAVFVYLAITHLGGAAVWICLLWLANLGAVGDPQQLTAAGATVQTVIIITAILGFGAKAGLIPLHVWLPRAHPLAPSHVSALMSGLMIKVALYGMIRVLFYWVTAPPLWAGIVLLSLGALSSIGGVVYALFQHELKRLLAFHSIENIGIITLGLGASLVFTSSGSPRWAAIALAAALLHTFNHAVFKSLLFLAAGAFHAAVHDVQLDHLGGLLRRMPFTGSAFLIGCMAIAGVPPLNGFSSEWLTFQVLIHSAVASLAAPARMAGAMATLLLAMTAALAVFCFVKVVGLVLLGPARRSAAETAHEVPAEMWLPMTFLAGLCVVLGAVPGLLVPALARLRPVGGGAVSIVLSVPGTSLPTMSVILALPLGTCVLIWLRGRRSSHSAPIWICGQLNSPALRWTSAGFTMPLRLILVTLLRARSEVDVTKYGGIGQGISYRASLPDAFDIHLYRPAMQAALSVAKRVRRLQSGSLQFYVATLLGLLIVMVALVRFGILG